MFNYSHHGVHKNTVFPLCCANANAPAYSSRPAHINRFFLDFRRNKLRIARSNGGVSNRVEHYDDNVV